LAGFLLVVGCARNHGEFTATLERPAGEHVNPPRRPPSVAFIWEATGGRSSGNIASALPDGEGFVGHFREIVPTTDPEWIVDFQQQWYQAWPADHRGGWPFLENPRDFVRAYSDHVLALLDTDEGDTMRCDFMLEDPRIGIAGGGHGHCQLLDGELIAARFPMSLAAD
jgi:hypothetical protein